MTDTLNQRSALADWEDEGGALQPITWESRNAGYFRERESKCRALASECGHPAMRSTYLGFAARYAALARYIGRGSGDIELEIVPKVEDEKTEEAN